MTLYYNPSFAIRDRTGVDVVTRTDGRYTLHMVDGTKASVPLNLADDSDVEHVIAAVKAAVAECRRETITASAELF